jgi:hypothetical protein
VSNFGIQIFGHGDGNYSTDGLGANAEAAIEQLVKVLEQEGLHVITAAVLAPEDPAPVELTPVAQLPVGVHEGPFKCPECGLAYLAAGSCKGGEYGHAPTALLPYAEAVGQATTPTDTATPPAETVVAAPQALSVVPPPAEAPAESSPGPSASPATVEPANGTAVVADTSATATVPPAPQGDPAPAAVSAPAAVPAAPWPQA